MSEVASPCTKVCKLDPRSGWCIGCYRTGGEIGAWMSLGDAGKREVLARCQARKQSPADQRRG
ncbi:DUF1289 domain-containing protein [bacterium]|nr:DUF1289 domain-containing protein [bacterium]